MDFIGHRRIWLTFSLLLAIASVVTMGANQVRTGSFLNFGIDFTGGSLLSYRLHEPVDTAKVRKTIAALGLGNSGIQKMDEEDIAIRSGTITPEKRQAVTDALRAAYPKSEILGEDTVGPVIGGELRQQAIWALIIASVLITIYVTYRFEFLYALAAMIALFHDGLITVGVVSFFHINVETPFIAAILTILGYSINDTIVIFDRIRENLHKQGKVKMPFGQLVNESLNQTMARSINTVLTVLFMNATLLIFGGAMIKDFSIVLLVGFTLGAYSSIFVAGPLLVSWLSRGGASEKAVKKA